MDLKYSVAEMQKDMKIRALEVENKKLKEENKSLKLFIKMKEKHNKGEN